jgi:hypothetical protein
MIGWKAALVELGRAGATTFRRYSSYVKSPSDIKDCTNSCDFGWNARRFVTFYSYGRKVGAAQAPSDNSRNSYKGDSRMGVMPRLKARFDSSLDLIARRLRDDGRDVAREALPRRWVDLIHTWANKSERVFPSSAQTLYAS